MRLDLIDDLPLFQPANAHRDALVRARMDQLANTIPAELTYVSFEDFERLWTRTTATTAEVLVPIGTRPRLLTARASVSDAEVVSVMTRRTLCADGKTGQVDIDAGNELAHRCAGRSVLIADDVAMSAHTLLAVLATLRQTERAPASVVVGTCFATGQAIERVRRAYPDVAVRTQAMFDYEPITGGTAIFLSDLLYGTLHDQPFLSQTELLRPFFGTTLAPLHNLRQDLDAA